MNLGSRKARQPTRAAWSMERLVHERALALGHVIDKSTLSNYSSALNSYLNFVTLHALPVEPTPDTLSLYTVYMCHHINPRSVNTYLSGISQQLEANFPAVKEARNSTLVRRTWQGCMRMKGVATVRKRALTTDDLNLVIARCHMSTDHDDLLFLAMLLTGFFGLLRLGEMTFPDDTSLRNWKKVTRRNTVKVTIQHYEFLLPGHKADRFFEGNKIIIPSRRFGVYPLQFFSKYLASRDALHPVASPLWLTESLPHWPNMVSLHTSYKPPVAGRPRHFLSTFAKTPPSSRASFTALPLPEHPPPSTFFLLFLSFPPFSPFHPLTSAPFLFFFLATLLISSPPHLSLSQKKINFCYYTPSLFLNPFPSFSRTCLLYPKNAYYFWEA